MSLNNSSAIPSSSAPTSSSSGSTSFTKLNGKNCSTWTFSLECMLTDLDLWDVCIRPIEPAADPIEKRKDAKARAKICLSCDESVYPIIRSAKSAYETLECLKKAFTDSGLTRRLGLITKLLAQKLQNSVQDYVNNLLAIQLELQGIGAEVEDEFLAIVMLTVSHEPL